MQTDTQIESSGRGTDAIHEAIREHVTSILAAALATVFLVLVSAF